MGMFSYALPNVVLPAGTLHTSLICSISGLTVPSGNQLVDIGDVTERIEESPGIIRLAEVTVDLIEDYSTYSQGFWYNVLSSGNFQLVFLLDEGSGLTFLFWGTTVGQTEQVNENYLLLDGTGAPVTGQINRSFQLTMASVLDLLTTVTFDTFIQQMKSYVVTAIDGQGYISFSDIFGAMMVSTFVTNVDHALSLYFRGYDVQFDDTVLSRTNIPASGLFMKWQNLSAVYNGKVSGSVYLSGTPGADYWGSRFDTPLALLGTLARSFGWLPRYFYDVTNSRHSLEFLTRGSWPPYTLTMPPIKRPSQIQLTTDFQATNFQISTLDNSVPSFQLPLGVTSFDFQQQLEFELGNTATGLTVPDDSNIFENSSGSSFTSGHIYTMMYDYITKALIYPPGPLHGSSFLTPALLHMYYNKFSRPLRSVIRTYKGVAPTENGVTSHTVIYPTKVTNINDGVSTRAFYANEVRKNPKKNELYVQWIEV